MRGEYGPEKDGCEIWTSTGSTTATHAAAALVERCITVAVSEPNAIVSPPLPTETGDPIRMAHETNQDSAVPSCHGSMRIINTQI